MSVDNQVLIALALTMFAGLSTGIGSAIAYFVKKVKMIYLSFGLGLSAGVMVYVSFVELLPQGFEGLGEGMGILVFFVGILFIFVIDILIPEIENPHHVIDTENREIVTSKIGTDERKEMNDSLMKTGVMTALAIGIHNFPEGLAAFGAALSDVDLGAVIAIAIAIHNIPEGISVSLPIFFATGDRKKAFWWSFLSGVAEPIGALLGYLILRPFITPALIGGLMAFIAGIMVYISMDEILPTAHSYGRGHEVVIGFVLGMLVMALSLWML